MKLFNEDNIKALKSLPDNSVDSVVTDPPYGLKFMGKKWDYDVPKKEFWEEVYRVLKPGGHVLSFGGTRTYHRMVVNMEDAGFEIRDQIMWIYGSGFPKSLNIGKQVDKIQGNEREVVGEQTHLPKRSDILVQGRPGKGSGMFLGDKESIPITKGSSPQEGWGTGLKPANEPICLARKPISEKTITENVLKWGTGGINVDGCRIGSEVLKNRTDMRDIRRGGISAELTSNLPRLKRIEKDSIGRFPANILFDEEAANILNQQNENTSRFFYVAKVSSKERNLSLDDFEDKDSSVNLRQQGGLPKADSEYKVKNNHPTVKPINLLTYLIRLITPQNGIVMDPFMGSGSTGIASRLEGFDFIGMELDSDYFKIAEKRIEKYEDYKIILEK